jgi:hypothetical protein
MPTIICQLRLRTGSPISRRQARDPPPAKYHGVAVEGFADALFAGAVVAIIRVAVPDPDPEMVSGEGLPKLRTGRSCAPAGLEIIVAVKGTLPAKPQWA